MFSRLSAIRSGTILVLAMTVALACRGPATSPPPATAAPTTVVPTGATTPTLTVAATATPSPRQASPVPTASPAPVRTLTPSPAPAPGTIPPPAISPTLAVAGTAAPVPRPADIKVARNRTLPDFPNKLTFSLEGSSGQPVRMVFLEFGTNKRSIVTEITRVQPAHGASTDINVNYSWEMRKTGSIPPGARVFWEWHITDSAGGAFTTPRQTVTWEDPRFSWRQWPSANLDIFYLNQTSALMKDLTSGLESNLSRIKLKVQIPPERKPRIYVYNDSRDVRNAILFTQEWTGALAFPDFNIILTAVDQSNLDWAKTALPHEVTHLLVGEMVFGPFGRLPTWLNEGLARYSEGEISQLDRDAINKALKAGALISVRSLSGSFPQDANQALLAYAESNSLVTHLIVNYGWDKMQQLLAVFKDGSTYDNGLKKVYGIDMDGLEREWKSKLPP